MGNGRTFSPPCLCTCEAMSQHSVPRTVVGALRGLGEPGRSCSASPRSPSRRTEHGSLPRETGVRPSLPRLKMWTASGHSASRSVCPVRGMRDDRPQQGRAHLSPILTPSCHQLSPHPSHLLRLTSLSHEACQVQKCKLPIVSGNFPHRNLLV